jgi:hypothetical protein
MRISIEDQRVQKTAEISVDRDLVFQVTSLLLHEKRGHFTHINMIGELCAQFLKGTLTTVRNLGTHEVIRTVEAYHKLEPEAARKAWHPEVFSDLGTPDWQQLYVNAEHDGEVGVVTLARESYSAEANAEFNRALDWLTAEGIDRVIVTGDFHLSTQMVGADTSDFYPAMENESEGVRISSEWSASARRLETDFAVSVGFRSGKRCLGGMLELMAHCHYLIAVDDALLGFPEVGLPAADGPDNEAARRWVRRWRCKPGTAAASWCPRRACVASSEPTTRRP